jgi:NADH/NAD ratio-sensing transcriptional regulator Rex
VWDDAKLQETIREKNIRIAILSGGCGGQKTADRLFRCGLTAILNMTDEAILSPYDRKVENSSLADSLSFLCCQLARKQQEEEPAAEE